MKPIGARKAAARAKSGDLGARLELTIGWIGAVARGKERLTAMQIITMGFVGALLAVGGAGLYKFLAPKSVRISTNDAAMLKGVFLSGQPWLVECTTGQPSDIMYKAESKLKAPLFPALLDCNAKLPSGKSTIERFGLDRPCVWQC